MSKIIRKNNDYVMIERSLMQDKDLSFTARGIAAYLASFEGQTVIELNDLFEQSKGNYSLIYNAIEELRQCGCIEGDLYNE